jgi:hypothetical protein
MKPRLNTLVPAAAFALAISGVAQAQMIAPTPYLSFADSPFASDSTTVLETFEDGALNVPGVTASASWFAASPSPFSDSVDADDGFVDGITTSGYAFYSANSQSSVTFTFDAQVLGALPTKAGLVWTDVGNVTSGTTGFGEVTFTARDANGNVIGTTGPTSVGDGTANGAAAEDRFFGVIHAGGISSITMTASNSVDWEVDHLQYAAPVPEPESIALFGVGGLLLAARVARRGRRHG